MSTPADRSPPEDDPGRGDADTDWQAIVKGFGAVPDPDEVAADVLGDQELPHRQDLPWAPGDWADEGGYRPPVPPPVPRPATPLLVAWVAVGGGPALLLLCLFAGIRPPAWAVLVLIAGVVTGFVFLIARSPRAPRDPWEDGAQV
ncbi:MAG: hypothetical protein ACRCYQ_15925 [Nocardioides sp.]